MKIAAAWVAVLLASNFSVIVWRAVLHREVPPWDPILRIVALAIILLLTATVPHLRSLSGFILALTALLVGNWASTLMQQTEAWRAWARTAPQYQQVFADMLTKLIPAALMAVTLIGSGLARSDLFLATGNLSATGRWPGLGRVPWNWAGPVLVVLFMLPLAYQLTLTARPDFRLLGQAMAALPLALVFAAINAASEEFRFRAVLLGRAQPVLGGLQAVWLTAVLFAIGHWFGRPSGPTGVVMAGVAGLIAGKSMLDTGGFLWAWLMHVLPDILIFAFVVMGR